MSLAARIFKSSLGKKYLMAISGALLLVFVIGHMLGNLQIFLGPEKLNAYGSFLQSNVEFLWAARIGLLVAAFIHIWSAVMVSRENKAARPIAYAETKVVAASYASRTMLMSGLIVACFAFYHLAHFTWQVPQINLVGTDFETLADARGRHDIYRMMIIGFSHPVVSLFYILGITLLCLHLSHGISSMFQSMGWRKKTYAPLLACLARAVAILLFIGYCSIPVAVMIGLVK